jgi:hypothetical protein
MNYQDGERDPLCTGWGTERDNHGCSPFSTPPAVSFIVVMPLCLPARFAQKFVAAEAVAAQCLFAVHYRFQTCIPGQRLTFPDKAFSWLCLTLGDVGDGYCLIATDRRCVALLCAAQVTLYQGWLLWATSLGPAGEDDLVIEPIALSRRNIIHENYDCDRSAGFKTGRVWRFNTMSPYIRGEKQSDKFCCECCR